MDEIVKSLEWNKRTVSLLSSMYSKSIEALDSIQKELEVIEKTQEDIRIRLLNEYNEEDDNTKYRLSMRTCELWTQRDRHKEMVESCNEVIDQLKSESVKLLLERMENCVIQHKLKTQKP